MLAMDGSIRMLPDLAFTKMDDHVVWCHLLMPSTTSTWHWYHNFALTGYPGVRKALEAMTHATNNIHYTCVLKKALTALTLAI